MRKLKNFLKVFSLVFLVLLVAAEASGRIALNLSPSVKPWLFFLVRHPAVITKGDYVIFRPKHMDPYINGKTLVKKVTCDEGDTLTEHGKKYFCNGDVYLGRAKDFSLKGERLKNFVYNGVIPKGFCFVSGSNINSYDSRYWGFLKKSDIEARAYPVF
ncbi:MAG: S26 family signal peptidase [Nitrospiraceae bacterium]|nr:S26 family signal peptidase [Nitrospiraceae bacterium]